MFEISDKDQDVIIKYMSYVATNYAEADGDLMAVASKLFSDMFEEASEDDGHEMAERLLNSVVDVKEQTNELLSCKGSADTLTSCLNKFENDEEKTEMLRYIISSLKKSDFSFADPDFNEEDILNKNYDELYDEMLKIAKQFSENFDYGHILNIFKNNSTSCILSEDDNKNKALYAMAFYCAAKKDELSFVPNTITPEMSAISVCTACEAFHLLSDTDDTDDNDDLVVMKPGVYYPAERKKTAQEERDDFWTAIFILLVFIWIFAMEAFLVAGFAIAEEPILAIILAFVFVIIDICCCKELLETNIFDVLIDLLPLETVTNAQTERPCLESGVIYNSEEDSFEEEDSEYDE